MTDEQYLARIVALEKTLGVAQQECGVLLEHTINGRQSSIGDHKRVYRRDSVRLDKIKHCLKSACAAIEQID